MLFKVSCWGICIAIILLTASCSRDPADLVQSANEATAKGEQVAAIVYLKEAIELDPEDGEKRYLLGQIYNATFDYPAAEKELLRARRRGIADSGNLEVELARALRGQAKFEELLEEVTDKPDFKPDARASIQALRGRAQHILNRAAEADTSFAQASKIAIDNPDVILLEAQIVSGRHEFERALKILDGLLAKDPDNFDGWSYKAEIFSALDRKDEALESYGQVLKINPASFLALMRRSALLVGKGQLDAARKDIAILQRVYGQLPQASVQQGMLQLAEGKAREALDSAQTALSKAPELPEAQLLAGLASYELRAYGQAQEYLEKRVAANPTRLASSTLADVLLQNGEPARALEVIEPLLLEKDPDVRVLGIAASAYAAIGDGAKVLEALERAAKSDPDNPNIQVSHALTRVGTGDVEAGINELESAVLSLHGASRADELLILTMLAAGDTARASSAVERLLKRAPDSAMTFNLKGAVLVAENKREDAVNAFEKALELDSLFVPAARNLAQMDIAAGKPERARSRYEAVIAADPKNSDALISLADLERQLGRSGQATELLEQAVKSAPTAVAPRERLLNAYLTAGLSQQANDLATETMSKFPREPRLIRLAAKAMLANGNQNQAEKAINMLLTLAPDSSQAYLEIAQFQETAGFQKSAEATLREGLSKQPKSAQIQIALISLLVKQERVDDAMKVANDIKSRQLEAPIGSMLEGEIFELTGKYGGAVNAYKSALKLQPVGQIAIKIFQARTLAGDPEAAFAEFKKWVAEHDKDIVGHAALADVLLARGDYKAAVEHYEKVVASKTVTVDVLNNMAWSYHQLKDNRAVEIAETAYRVAPNSGMVADTLGWILLNTKEAERGLELLRKASLLKPERPEISYHLAVALARTGNRDEAKSKLIELLATDKKFPMREEAEELLGTLN